MTILICLICLFQQRTIITRILLKSFVFLGLVLGTAYICQSRTPESIIFVFKFPFEVSSLKKSGEERRRITWLLYPTWSSKLNNALPVDFHLVFFISNVVLASLN